MSKWEVLKTMHAWEQGDTMKAKYVSLVVSVINRQPKFLDRIVSKNPHDEKALWDVIKEGV